jgi:GMP synthase (glutamine-hydrolysing)
MFVSGGVDSTVAAALLAKAKQSGRDIGSVRLVHVDNGLMRLNESAQVVDYLKKLMPGQDIIFEDASAETLKQLEGVVDPERKRKIIGDAFVEVQDRLIQRLGLRPDTVLCQGTLYTDRIESNQGVGNKASVIKTHHNVGSPYIMEKRKNGLVVEPNREWYKDEVRKVGELLGLPSEFVWRQPFPGPGLGIRLVGVPVTRENLDVLRKAEDIYGQEIAKAGLSRNIQQYFAVLLGAKSVGVMGDERTHQYVCALRAVNTDDFMTANWFDMPHDLLRRISGRIVNEVKGINRVLYDVTTKPPGTIEFE